VINSILDDEVHHIMRKDKKRENVWFISSGRDGGRRQAEYVVSDSFSRSLIAADDVRSRCACAAAKQE
jgi:hypothetical protein